MQGNEFEAWRNLAPWCIEKFNFEKKLKIIQFSLIRICRASLISGLAQLELQSPSYQPVSVVLIMLGLHSDKSLMLFLRATIVQACFGKDIMQSC